MNDLVIKRGDIFWAELPEVAGSVQKGRRPVLIIQNDIGNRFSQTVIVAAVTSQASKRPYPVNVNIPEGLLPMASEVKLNQIRTLAISQLGKKMATLPSDVMNRVDQALLVSLGLPRGFA